jgi:hypothetical protein
MSREVVVRTILGTVMSQRHTVTREEEYDPEDTQISFGARVEGQSLNRDEYLSIYGVAIEFAMTAGLACSACD